MLTDTHLTLLSDAKVHVSTILGGPLGKATVKAKSITDSEEKIVAVHKSFSSEDRSRGGGAGGRKRAHERDIC